MIKRSTSALLVFISLRLQVLKTHWILQANQSHSEPKQYHPPLPWCEHYHHLPSFPKLFPSLHSILFFQLVNCNKDARELLCCCIDKTPYLARVLLALRHRMICHREEDSCLPKPRNGMEGGTIICEWDVPDSKQIWNSRVKCTHHVPTQLMIPSRLWLQLHQRHLIIPCIFQRPLS